MVRLLLPDLVVFAASLLTLIVDIFVVKKLKPGDSQKAERRSTTDEHEETNVEARHVSEDGERGTSPLDIG